MTLRLSAALVVCAAFMTGNAVAETVTIAAEDDWAPYSSVKADKSGPEGLSPDLVRAAFKTQGVDVVFLAVPFARCLQYAKTGRALACFNATIIDSNRDVYHWHPTPLFEEELAIFGPQSAPDTPVTVKDLEGRNLGVTIGYTYPTEIMENKKIRKFSATSDHNLLQMLAAKRVDYILINTMPGYMRIYQDPQLKGRIKKVGVISLDGFWLGFSKADKNGQRLAETFEKGLRQIKADGTYQKIYGDFRKRFGQ